MPHPISTRAHSIISYSMGSLVLFSPELLRLKDVVEAARVPRIAGATALSYSVITDFELGAVRLLPMRLHLALDAMGGALLAASPWLFGFASKGRRFWMPHLLQGTGVVAVAALTRTQNEA